jgi:hypothetical protein
LKLQTRWVGSSLIDPDQQIGVQMPIMAPALTATSALHQALDEARQHYESARVAFDQAIGGLSATRESDDEVRAIQDALSALTEAEARFCSALRDYAQTVRDSAIPRVG